MGADFLTYNDAGDVQFDIKSHAFGFVGKGSLTITDHWTGTPYGGGSNFTGTHGSVVTDYDFDLVFFRCDDGFILPANRPFTTDPAMREQARALARKYGAHDRKKVVATIADEAERLAR